MSELHLLVELLEIKKILDEILRELTWIRQATEQARDK